MKRSFRTRCVTAGFFAMVVGSGPKLLANPVVGYVDTFTGSTNPTNWGNLAGATDLIATGGPGGVNDSYIRITASGGGQGGALAMNTFSSSWTGNYQSAGVTSLAVDLLSPSANTTTPLQIRPVLFGQAGGRFTSIVPFLLPNDGAWHHAVFPIGSTDLNNVGSAGDSYAAMISNSLELMFRYAVTSTQSGGTGVIGTLGLDNITAVGTVPEPTGLLLIPLGVAALLRRSRRRQV